MQRGLKILVMCTDNLYLNNKIHDLLNE